MKKILVLLALACWTCISSAQMNVEMVERLCDNRIKYDTEKAEWGLALRADMLKKCGRAPSKACVKPWVDKINATEQGDIAYIIEKTRQDYQPGLRTIVINGVKQSHLAAMQALLSGDFAQTIANEQYMECVRRGLANTGRSAPSQPTAAPAATSACTNYSILGQNGNTQYCQKCCWGSNNCNVTCY